MRAITSFVRQEIFHKKFVVFGYGKVGKGIIHTLLKFSDNITVVEKDRDTLMLAQKKGINVECVRH